ncbi:unnamed protein product [Schistocephalus solidus]|uniref:Uncharacterized protein n=1 Tax=Schistocephalus solidus TaxID=70667 RepID=A0A183TG07_SCHSO|nr:unnamed protein product [Schistocephalus solidus]
MSIKRGAPIPRKTPEARYADESEKCTKLELPPITEPASCGFRDNSSFQSNLAPCGNVASSKPRLRPCLPGRQMRFKVDRPLRSVQRRLDSQLPANGYRRSLTELDRNHSNQSTDEQTTFAPGLPLRSGRTYQDYVDAHTFARDLASSRLKASPTKLKQSSAALRIDTSSKRGLSEQQFLEPIGYDHCTSGDSGHICPGWELQKWN